MSSFPLPPLAPPCKSTYYEAAISLRNKFRNGVISQEKRASLDARINKIQEDLLDPNLEPQQLADLENEQGSLLKKRFGYCSSQDERIECLRQACNQALLGSKKSLSEEERKECALLHMSLYPTLQRFSSRKKLAPL